MAVWPGLTGATYIGGGVNGIAQSTVVCMDGRIGAGVRRCIRHVGTGRIRIVCCGGRQPVALLRFNRRSQTPKPFQIFFDGWAIFDPRAAVALGERLGLIAAHEGQLQWRLQIVQQRHLNVILSGDVIDLDARASGDGGAQLDTFY